MIDTFEIVFDGGSLGNPGKGYGSFDITRNGKLFDRQIEVKFGNAMTNNQAEYLSLIGALKSIVGNSDVDPENIAIIIRGDSKLVINQINGVWKVKHINMQPLWAEARGLLADVKDWKAIWHDRSNSVRKLGH